MIVDHRGCNLRGAVSNADARVDDPAGLGESDYVDADRELRWNCCHRWWLSEMATSARTIVVRKGR